MSKWYSSTDLYFWMFYFWKVKRLKMRISLCGKPSQSYGASLVIWDYSVTCHLTQLNVPCLNPSQPGRYSIYLPRRDGRLSWSRQLDSGPTRNRPHDRLIASPIAQDEDGMIICSSVMMHFIRRIDALLPLPVTSYN